MPQLDLLTFFTQFFWAVLCLFLFYFFVSKLILPELTRVLKYRSKASALSNAGDRLDLVSHAGQDGSSETFSHSSAKSGSSTLYQYAINSSARALTEARQKRNTFLDSVISGKAVGTERSISKGSESPYSTSSSNVTTTRSVKVQGEVNIKQSKNSDNLKNSAKSSKSSKSLSAIPETIKKSESAKSSKGLKGSKNLSRDSKSSKEPDSFKS